MGNSEQQPIVYKTIIIVNVVQQPPIVKSFCWGHFLAKASLFFGTLFT